MEKISDEVKKIKYLSEIATSCKIGDEIKLIEIGTIGRFRERLIQDNPFLNSWDFHHPCFNPESYSNTIVKIKSISFKKMIESSPNFIEAGKIYSEFKFIVESNLYQKPILFSLFFYLNQDNNLPLSILDKIEKFENSKYITVKVG